MSGLSRGDTFGWVRPQRIYGDAAWRTFGKPAELCSGCPRCIARRRKGAARVAQVPFGGPA